MLKSYKAVPGQTIYDVCLMLYGTLDLVYKLAKDNGRNIYDGINNGDEFTYDTDLQQNQQIITLGYVYATDGAVGGGVFNGVFTIQFD